MVLESAPTANGLANVTACAFIVTASALASPNVTFPPTEVSPVINKDEPEILPDADIGPITVKLCDIVDALAKNVSSTCNPKFKAEALDKLIATLRVSLRILNISFPNPTEPVYIIRGQSAVFETNSIVLPSISHLPASVVDVLSPNTGLLPTGKTVLAYTNPGVNNVLALIIPDAETADAVIAPPTLNGVVVVIIEPLSVIVVSANAAPVHFVTLLVLNADAPDTATVAGELPSYVNAVIPVP